MPQTKRKTRKKKTNKAVVNRGSKKINMYTLCIIVLLLICYVATKYLFNNSQIDVKSSAVQKINSYTEKENRIDNDSNKNSNLQVILHGDRGKKQIALTFDAEMTDGMKKNLLTKKVDSSFDIRIIEILTQTQTKATLFLTGMWIELYSHETEELSRNPLFELGSHSYTDSSFDGYCYGLKQLHAALKFEEIGATEKLLRTYGHIDNQLFRFPGGCYSDKDVKLVNLAGDTVVHWDVVGEDGFNQNSESIIQKVVNTTQNGSIIVLHMNGKPTAPKTAEALPGIISKLREKGFEFVKVSELLNLPIQQRLD